MYAVLSLPNFALQAVLRVPSADGRVAGAEPVVLVDAQATKAAVLDMTDAAAREGVEIGLPLSQALARCPGLAARYRSERAESLAASALFDAAYSLSPRVEALGPGLCLVDLRGTKGATSLERCEAILAELEGLELRCCIGIADASSVALLAAKASRVAQSSDARALLVAGEDADGWEGGGGARTRRVARADFLAALPVAAAEPEERLLDILDKWGIRTVGAFAALPRASVGARLGVSGLALWDRVNGREERVVAVADLPESFEQSWEFEYEVDSLEPLLFLLRRFLDQLCLRLRAAGKVAERLRLEVKLAYGEPLVWELKVPEPSCEVEALFRLAAGRLETAKPESLAVAFSLVIAPIDYRQRQLGLFESSLRNPGRFGQTLARVAGIVGADRVGRAALEDDGRPDGFRMESLPAEVEPMAQEASLKSHYGMALRRFRPARLAAVELQGRQPIWIQCEGASGFVKACRGPWLHSGHWWEESGQWSRVEWDVELSEGGLYRLVKEEGKWVLEGEYD